MPDEINENTGDLQPADEAMKGATVAIRKATLVSILAGVLVAIVVGASGYILGKHSGEDLDAARAKGTSLGTSAAEDRGQTQGFRAGFKKGKALGFAVSFNQSYKRAYIDTWEEAGLEAPAKNEIKVASR